MLDKLRKENIESFVTHLKKTWMLKQHDKKTNKKNAKAVSKSSNTPLSPRTTNRKLASLKSLFHWLSVLSEDENGDPYLRRNVMAKIEIISDKETRLHRARVMRSKILVDDQTQRFVDFVYNGYLRYCDTQQKKDFHMFNRNRDVAIIALILSTGLRVSEVANLNLPDINLETKQLTVIRKGNKEDKPSFSEWGKHYLQRYLDERYKYNPPQNEEAVFLALSPTNQDGHRISIRAIQTFIKRYGQAFGVPELTVHKLRHSFATNFLRENPDRLEELQAQLGHSNDDTTRIYAHVLDDTLSEAVERTTGFKKE
ncbi:tyrosine recombinase XerS [Brevibacillus agri]|uniref:tyrosine recombinase XerS n=1 Tax=Brevibacillus agri TaxID=51101 RepID=UPI0025B66A33|nr:tyrosine recombinase XerS [Brevibacillus agri]MDN4096263.1 tyrosine recombinase XerS [Brevibacillus agri]